MTQAKEIQYYQTVNYNSDAYILQKVIRQTAGSAIEIPSKVLNAAGYYRTHTADFISGALPHVYQGKASILYHPGSRFTKSFQRAFLPSEYQTYPLDAKAQAKLRASGAHLVKNAHTIIQVSNGVIIVGGAIALSQCMDGNCDPVETAAITSDITWASLDIYAINRFNKGLSYIKTSGHKTAYPLLFSTQKIMVGLGTFRAISGATRLAVEIDRYLETGDANCSTMIHGGLDLASGATVIARSTTKLHQSAAVSNVVQKNSVLGFNAVRYSTGTTWFLRATGGAGAAIGIGTNAYVLADSYFDDTLDPVQRERNIISSLIGITGSSFLLASALIVAPPLAPVAIVLAIVGIAILIGQSVYDHWDEGGLFDNKSYALPTAPYQVPLEYPFGQ